MKPTTTSKSDLAVAYFTYVSASRARHKRIWCINQDKRLSERLAETGYDPRVHSFTPKQTALIIEHLGNPF